jgi:hypothetical protein
MRLSPTTVERLAPFVPRRDLEAMRAVTGAPGRWIPGLFGMSATTTWNCVFFRQGSFDEATPRGLALIAHEAVHITQVRKMTLPLFLARYVLGQFQCRFRHDSHPLEAPAIVVQRRVREALEG